MHRHFWLVLTLVLIWPIFCRAADPTFSEAIGLLSQERSYAESGAAIVKRYAPNDIEARRLYADAKGAFDSLIEQLLADLAQNRDPNLSGTFRERLDAAVVKRVAFSKRVEEVVKPSIPEGARPAVLVTLAEALAKTGDARSARENYARARDVAEALPPTPDRDDWLRQADQGLQRK